IVGANKEKVKSQVIATSLNHQIISPYTSFIAVEKLPEVSSLLAKNDLLSVKKLPVKKLGAKKAKSNTMQAHESLLVVMPQTSLGWQLQLMIGIALLLLGLTLMKISDYTWLAKRCFNMVSRREKPH
ncbi:MAG: hypothetical protein QNK36_14465, partial [Colwellia sp.]|nr:hypothetical protein [Colwellia sp.]